MLNMFNENVEAEIELSDALTKANVLLTREVVHARTGMEIHYHLEDPQRNFKNTHIIHVYDYMQNLPLVQLMNNCTYELWNRSGKNFYKLMGDFVKVKYMMQDRAQRKKL